MPEHMAKAVGRGLPISTKHAIEICSFIRNKQLSKAKGILTGVMNKKLAIPFKRFNSDVGHKTKIGPGRFPTKASKELLKLLEGVEANAQFKGLNTAELVIGHICAHKARKAWKYGRFRGRQMKRTNVEVIVKEVPKTRKHEKAVKSGEIKK